MNFSLHLPEFTTFLYLGFELILPLSHITLLSFFQLFLKFTSSLFITTFSTALSFLLPYQTCFSFVSLTHCISHAKLIPALLLALIMGCFYSSFYILHSHRTPAESLAKNLGSRCRLPPLHTGVSSLTRTALHTDLFMRSSSAFCPKCTHWYLGLFCPECFCCTVSSLSVTSFSSPHYEVKIHHPKWNSVTQCK